MYRKQVSRGKSFGGKKFSRGGSRNGNGGVWGPANGRRGKKRPYELSDFVRKATMSEDAPAFEPKHRFDDFQIHPKLKQTVARRKFTQPTPIQDGAIPAILEGRDVVGIANTGTGKTAAFLLPLIHKVFSSKGKEKVLILVPTRELALQINEEFLSFSNGSGLRSALLIGGAHMDRQIRELRNHPTFVIGTPGRVKDLIERGFLNLSDFNNVVLDEVDRMLDMGFVRDIKFLLSLLSKERQTLFFSATMERGVRDMAASFLQNPVTIAVKSRATSENVNQDVLSIETKEQKVETLHDLLLKEEFRKVIVFNRTKHGADKLARTLSVRGFKAGAIHGNLSQRQRERALSGFRENRIQVLVATDVAARGLDIPNVTHVINYDLPETYEDYIHRIGRTGRGSNVGYALTFVEQFASEEYSVSRNRRSR